MTADNCRKRARVVAPAPKPRKPSNRTKIKRARDAANHLIAGFSARGGIAGALSAEGYNGGYRDALNDVLLLLGGTAPHRYPFFE